MFRSMSTVLMLSVVACTAESIELDGPVAAANTSNSPDLVVPEGEIVIAAENEFVSGIAVDSARIYWSVGLGWGAYTGALRSCLKNNCQSTQITYPTENVFGISPSGTFRVSAREIFWRALDSGGGKGSGIPPSQKVFACSVGECQSPREVISGVAGFEVDEINVYYETEDWPGYSVAPRSGAPVPPRRLPSWGANGPKPLEAGSTSYLSGVEEHFYSGPEFIAWISERGSLMSQRKDGTSPPTLLVEAFSTPDSYGAPAPWVAIDEHHVYWPVSSLAGFINRCALAGCPEGPELAVAQQQRPRIVIIDRDQLVFGRQAADRGSNTFEIVSCPKRACESQQHVGTIEIPFEGPPGSQPLTREPPMAVDETHAYVVAWEVDSTGAIRSRIVRFAR